MKVKCNGVDRRFNERHYAAEQDTAGQQIADGECHTEVDDCETDCFSHSVILLTDIDNNYHLHVGKSETVFFNHIDS